MYGTPPIDAPGHDSLAGDRPPTPLFGDDTQSFTQQMRLAAQAHRAGRLDEAIGSYLRLLNMQPHHAELHNNLGVALRLAGKLEASVCHHRLSLAAEPDNPALHSNLGNALRAANRLDEAATHHFRSISLNRGYAEGFFNLALCLRDLGRVEESIGCFTRSLSLDPDNPRVKAEHAIALLMRGEMEAGFAAYEVRKQLADWPRPDFSKPAWLGGPIGGRRILLYPEQGLSDVLLFVRFARELKRRGAIVIVLCQALLKDLLAGVDYVDEVVSEGELLPSFDVHASLVSLPHLCHVDLDAVPAEPAYLRAPPTSRIRLGHVERATLRVGVYWAAMPGQAHDRRRSAPFSEIMALAGDPDLLVFSLQGGAAQKEIEQLGAGGLVHDVGRGIFDFAEAATALAQLDLLVSIDAPIAHLAAAMGIRTWVLLPQAADWRWRLRSRSGSWHRTARLFVQPRAGDWAAVFAAVRRELATLKQQAAAA